MVMDQTTLTDLIGIEHTKLGFFQELQKTIEELKASHEESESQRREIAAILDGITDIMMVLSEDLRIISVNHEFEKLFGKEDQFKGEYCYKVFRQSNKACAECPAFNSLSTNTVCKDIATFRVNNQNRQFEMIASPLKSPNLSENRVLIFKRDVTLEKEYQAKYYQAEKMATVGTLATGVAHEVNNPLMAISGFAEGIQRRLAKYGDKLPQELAEDFECSTQIILKECNRCQDIVKSLLSFGHPCSSVFHIVFLNSLIEETIALVGFHLRRSANIKLTLDLTNNLHIKADEPQMKQVILNLLTNASDAIGEAPGELIVRTYPKDQDWVVLEVEDTGKGIDPAIRHKLFDPFFTTKPVGKGIGIGLSTCYNIVKDHHGEIEVISELGKGSKFIVSLPSHP
ncbi:ATP-binding protein [Pseudodesulfovibrio sp. zrk46]|uniref:two-component system sensor histidine kinase NtrB n=1 Tax=Pseudodesulfovibrio sp. zrk46 TaxID=2725288 RepID=UPI0014497D5C|nr:ATP-binding protein [Pseudodesulfovibrio sp. zrk46]QJB57439.1 PAS domain-containing protein [Pseudodesulfovibrio sp. zrk46]